MDGNGRWAQRRLLPRSAGHRAGFRRMLELSEYAFESGVKCLTLYALSAENLRRPQEELDELFGIFREYFSAQTEKLHRRGIRILSIGDRTLLPEDIQGRIAEAENATAGGTVGTLVLAIAYGGRQEIVAAVNRAVRAGREVTEEEFSALLDTGSLPPPDLLIRTGRETRLSNFLLYQSAYTELYFSKKLFPDFTKGDFDKALKEYSLRDRRFGRV